MNMVYFNDIECYTTLNKRIDEKGKVFLIGYLNPTIAQKLGIEVRERNKYAVRITRQKIEIVCIRIYSNDEKYVPLKSLGFSSVTLS